jgi:hypothetical protein
MSWPGASAAVKLTLLWSGVNGHDPLDPFMASTCMHARGCPLPYEFMPCDVHETSDLCSHTKLIPAVKADVDMA